MRTRLAVAAAAIAVVAALVAGAYGLQILRISRHVAMPSPTASPEQVVETYIHALNEHDCDTAAALWAVGNGSEGRQWCYRVEHVTAWHLQQMTGSLGPNSITVSAMMRVDRRLLSGDDTLPGGPFGWSYDLIRQRDGWRISNNGQG